MINFRFHLVSLIAVFLALALGIVVGSTLIDRVIVDRLNDRINRVEHNANARKAENDELRGQLGQVQDSLQKMAQFAVTRRLDGVTVVPIAGRGVDDDVVRNTVTLARQAGALAPGILWIERKFGLSDGDATKQLGQIVGKPGESAKATREAAWSALAIRLGGGTAAIGTTERTGNLGDVLGALSDGRFVSFETVGNQAGDLSGLGGFPGSDTRVLLVDGVDGKMGANQLVVPLSKALVTTRLPLVVAEVYREHDNGPNRGATVTVPIQNDDGLKEAVSTVDDLDLEQGRVSAVLALSDLGSKKVGHYGYGSGAKQSIPDWSST